MAEQHPVQITQPDGAVVAGDLAVPDGAPGLVVFAHGSGSSRSSPRNQQVAATLNDADMATLLFDLLSPQEEVIDARTRELRFDIGLLAERLVGTAKWLAGDSATKGMPIGYFGASTGAAAAMVAAGRRPAGVAAVVSRGGRPDLADGWLTQVRAPTLLIVGGLDTTVIKLNRVAYDQLGGERALEIVAGASHLFEEPGTLDEVARLAGDWFARHLDVAAAGAGPT